MSWEDSRAATPLKRDFLKAFFRVSRGFFLTGGSALGIFHLQHRISYDLDLFTLELPDWHLLDNELRRLTQELRIELQSVTASPLFRRYSLRRGVETEVVDLVVEQVPQVEPDKLVFGDIRVDTMREILANKLCTLVSRSEVKDLIDLYFLAQAGWRPLEHLADAQAKQGGVEPGMLSYILSEIRIRRLPEYLIKPCAAADIQSFVEDLRRQLADRAFPA